jgi:thioredoxin 1
MVKVKKLTFSFIGLTLLAAGFAFGGPCCNAPAKECGTKKQCATPSATNKPDDSSRGVTAQNRTVPDKTILFFMNPNGHPCRMQLAVLDGMKDKLSGLASVKYIKTTEPADLETFDKYGIRGLPSLIILDKTGREIKRFTPGIQDEQGILDALK